MQNVRRFQDFVLLVFPIKSATKKLHKKIQEQKLRDIILSETGYGFQNNGVNKDWTRRTFLSARAPVNVHPCVESLNTGVNNNETNER